MIRCDLRGYGRSPRPTAASPAPAEDVMALLRELGSAPMHVVGHSLGGAVAVDLALAHPEAVRPLTLVGAGLAGFRWATFGISSARVRSVARGHGLEAARRAWLQDPLFASAMERPQVAGRLERMVAAYSGWRASATWRTWRTPSGSMRSCWTSSGTPGRGAALKEQPGPDGHVYGSANLLQTLLVDDLVDALWLRIHPITLGQGKRLFEGGAIPAAFCLAEHQATSTGVVLATFERAGAVPTADG